MGLCPCPRCLTPKTLFSFLGLASDMKSHMNNLWVYVMANVVKAHEFIYTWGNTVDSAKVGNTLGEGSWVPTLASDFLLFYDQFKPHSVYSQNQFVTKLGPLGFDTFRMLVVDFMHECKLGMWKGLFIHLIRLLYALPRGNELVAALDSRYEEVVGGIVTC
jgi:hypothetical protein